MTKQELELLKNISLSLKKSTKITWDSGNFEQWVDYAKIMQTVNRTNCIILDTLIANSNIYPSSGYPVIETISTPPTFESPLGTSKEPKDPNGVDPVSKDSLKTPVWKNGQWE